MKLLFYYEDESPMMEYLLLPSNMIRQAANQQSNIIELENGTFNSLLRIKFLVHTNDVE